MELMTKEITHKAQGQYPLGSDMDNQLIIAKFFDPCGTWTWYLMNQDPDDSDYLWGIVKGNEIEVGSFSLSDLQNYKGSLGIGIERDLYFMPINANELWNKLLRGEYI